MKIFRKIWDKVIDFKNFLVRKKILSNENLIPTFICFMLAIGLVFIIIMQVDNYQRNLSQSKSEKINNEMLKATIKDNTKKINDGNYDGKDAYVEKKLSELLNDEDLTNLTKGYWNYQLKINDVLLKNDDTPIVVNSGDVNITIIENEKNRVLPVNIHAKGMVTSGDKNDSFYDHILFPPNANYSLVKNDQPGVHTATYILKGLTKGQKIALYLSEPLTNRLEFKTPELTISAN